MCTIEHQPLPIPQAAGLHLQQMLYFYFFQRNEVKVEISYLKSTICFPRRLHNHYASVFPEQTGPKVSATWHWNGGSQGDFPEVRVCSSARGPVSGTQLNVWTKRKINLSFVLMRGNLMSENISHISKPKLTKPKALIARGCPTFWNVWSSRVSLPL